MGSMLPDSPKPTPNQQEVLGEKFPYGEQNALRDLLGHTTPLEQRKYPVSAEIRWVTSITIVLAALTTPVFPFLPETVDVGGWALWWLGGSITAVMEFVARYWPVEVSLGGVTFLLTLYLVIASHWLRDAPEKLQWLMAASPVFIVPNVLGLVAIIALWAVVVLIWLVIFAIVLAIIGSLLVKLGEAMS
jgi:hypothetical protein